MPCDACSTQANVLKNSRHPSFSCFKWDLSGIWYFFLAASCTACLPFSSWMASSRACIPESRILFAKTFKQKSPSHLIFLGKCLLTEFVCFFIFFLRMHEIFHSLRCIITTPRTHVIMHLGRIVKISYLNA